MKSVLLTSLLLAAVTFSTKAFANTDWYLYHPGTNSCAEASTLGPSVDSPQDAIDSLRNQGLIPTTQITRNPDGSIRTVEIVVQLEAGAANSYLNYFSSQSDCEGYCAYLIQNGQAADPDELK